MGPKQKADHLRSKIKKQIKNIPLAGYSGSFGGEGGPDHSGRESLEKWFIIFYAKSKLADRPLTARRKAYWKKVMSFA